jgi:hypothetical protein
MRGQIPCFGLTRTQTVEAQAVEGSRDLTTCAYSLGKLAQRPINRWNRPYFVLRDPHAPETEQGSGPRRFKVINGLHGNFTPTCGHRGFRFLAWEVRSMASKHRRYAGGCTGKWGTSDADKPLVAAFDCNGKQLGCGRGVMSFKSPHKQNVLLVMFPSGIPDRYWLDYGDGAVKRNYRCGTWDGNKTHASALTPSLLEGAEYEADAAIQEDDDDDDDDA